MSVERTTITPDLAAWLDAVAATPEPVQRLAAQMVGHPQENMMTHPELGALLAVLVRATGGHRVLEIGTFVGTSALWMAPELAPDGHIDCLDVSQDHADRAADVLREAGYHDEVTIHVAPALDTLPALGPGYDLAYIDADKPAYPAYLRECTRLVRPGGIIVADNVFGGQGDAAQVAALRDFAEGAMADPGLATVVLPIGDGITLSVVR
jgi:predicted O-methyltransferase YrrM